MTQQTDLTGQRFGKLVVVRRHGSIEKETLWECLCDCGKTHLAKGTYLKKNSVKSCGCLFPNKGIPYPGWRSGRLEAISGGYDSKRKDTYWLCKCDCGAEKEIRRDALINGHAKSCGCLRRSRRKYLEVKDPTILKLYAEGKTLKEVAELTKLSIPYIQLILRRHKIKKDRIREIPPENIELVKQLWAKNLPVDEIVDKTGISSTYLKILTNKGILPSRFKAKSQRQQRAKKFKLPTEAYEELLLKQGGHCAICKNVPTEDRRLAIDHCHKSGIVRGLLCSRCNIGLGYFLDDPIRLKSAIEYLEKSPTPPEGS